MAEQE